MTRSDCNSDGLILRSFLEISLFSSYPPSILCACKRARVFVRVRVCSCSECVARVCVCVRVLTATSQARWLARRSRLFLICLEISGFKTLHLFTLKKRTQPLPQSQSGISDIKKLNLISSRSSLSLLSFLLQSWSLSRLGHKTKQNNRVTLLSSHLRCWKFFFFFLTWSSISAKKLPLPAFALPPPPSNPGWCL